MARSLTSSQILIFPLVILAVVLLEEVCTYEMRLRIDSPEGRALAAMALNALAFTLAARYVSPWLKRRLLKMRAASRSQAGAVGVWSFFLLAYVALFFAYLRLERVGAAGLIPERFR